MPEEKKDVTQDENTGEKNESKEKDSTSEESSTSQTDVTKEVDELLSDGTSRKKEVTLSYDRFSSLNKDAQEAHELRKKVEELNEKVSESSISKDDVSRIVEEKMGPITLPLRAQRERETREVLAEALGTYPDFKAQWGEIQPLVESLESKGISYRDAVKRAYVAVNPSFAVKMVELEASTKDRERGVTSFPPGSVKEKESRLTPEQQEEARRRGWDEDKYLRMTAEKIEFELPTKSKF